MKPKVSTLILSITLTSSLQLKAKAPEKEKEKDNAAKDEAVKVKKGERAPTKKTKKATLGTSRASKKTSKKTSKTQEKLNTGTDSEDSEEEEEEEEEEEKEEKEEEEKEEKEEEEEEGEEEEEEEEEVEIIEPAEVKEKKKAKVSVATSKPSGAFAAMMMGGKKKEGDERVKKRTLASSSNQQSPGKKKRTTRGNSKADADSDEESNDDDEDSEKVGTKSKEEVIDVDGGDTPKNAIDVDDEETNVDKPFSSMKSIPRALSAPIGDPALAMLFRTRSKQPDSAPLLDEDETIVMSIRRIEEMGKAGGHPTDYNTYYKCVANAEGPKVSIETRFGREYLKCNACQAQQLMGSIQNGFEMVQRDGEMLMMCLSERCVAPIPVA